MRACATGTAGVVEPAPPDPGSVEPAAAGGGAAGHAAGAGIGTGSGTGAVTGGEP